MENYFEKATNVCTEVITSGIIPIGDYNQWVMWNDFLHLIGEDTFNELVESTESNFTTFHKLFRQTDVITDIYKVVEVNTTKEWKESNGELKKWSGKVKQLGDSLGGRIDNLIWYFITSSDVPQYVYYFVQNKDYDGKDL